MQHSLTDRFRLAAVALEPADLDPVWLFVAQPLEQRPRPIAAAIVHEADAYTLTATNEIDDEVAFEPPGFVEARNDQADVAHIA